MPSKQDPDRKGYRPTIKEEARCLKCQNKFMSPDRKRIRICPECKQKRTRTQDYNIPITVVSPNDH